MDFLTSRYIASANFAFNNIDIPVHLQLATKILLQHCLPPPSLKEIKTLFEILADADIDSNWCVQCEREELHQLIDTLPSETNTEDDIDELAEDYPVYFGVYRINQLRGRKWSDASVRICIDAFVTRVYSLTEVGSKFKNSDAYYRDIIAIRDDTIKIIASNQSLLTHPKTRKGEDKLTRALEISSRQKLIGGHLRQLEATDQTFWDNPPEIKIKPRTSSAKTTYEIGTETKDIEFIDTNPFGLLDTSSQTLLKRNFIKDFSRENVRTFSDRSQLSRETVSQYLAYLAEKNKTTFFTVALLRAVTGIEQQRLFYPQKTKDHKPWVIKLDDTNNTVSYTVSNGATDFAKGKGKESTKAADVSVRVPVTLYNLLKVLFYSKKNTVDQSGVQRTFKLNHAGPVPTLDRIARSSYLIYRSKHLDENACFVLSGNIPVYRRASNSYISTENEYLATGFLKILNDILKDVSQVIDNGLVTNIRRETDELLGTKGLRLPIYMVGSQLATQPPFNFYAACTNYLSTLNLSPIASRAGQVDQALEILSQHEAYYYFVLQFANAARTVGPNTTLNETLKNTLYKEKSSKHYTEYKLLNTLTLVSQQLEQLVQMREHVYSFLKAQGYLIGPPFDTGLALKYSANHRKEIIKTDILNGKAAHIIASNWGYKPLFERTNSPRHICASSIQASNGAAIRDAWLGHHIDGFAPTSPNSSGNPRSIFEHLDELRYQFMTKHSFQLLKKENLYGAP